MPREAGIPTKPRFHFATQRAYELLAELGISEFPVDPRKIIDHFPSWHLHGWLELQHHTEETDPLYLEKEQAEAKTVKLRGKEDYLIVYDERIDNMQRIRWTLAHEIGHIVLGHLVHFDATSLNRRGLTKKEYEVLEVEAHWFAADLLAPMTIIRKFDFQDKSQGIGLICGISKAAADKKLERIKKPNYDYYPTENMILRNFYNHLRQGDYLQVMHKTACHFCPSTIYSDLCKESRICRECNSFVPDEKDKYCPQCGQAVPLPEKYSPYSPMKEEQRFRIGFSGLYLTSKQYYEVPLDKNNRLEFCPVCRNIKTIEGSDFCIICGIPTHNRCTEDNKVLPHAHPYCTDCGAETTFNEVYEKLPERLNVENINVPAHLDDYIECEYWPFIVMTIGYWAKDKETFLALEDSVAFYDCENMVIFVRTEKDVQCVKQGEDTILECLAKYGASPVTSVNAMGVKAKTKRRNVALKV